MKRQENNTYITETPVHCNDNSSTMETLVGGVSIIITDIEGILTLLDYLKCRSKEGLWVKLTLLLILTFKK